MQIYYFAFIVFTKLADLNLLAQSICVCESCWQIVYGAI